MKRVIISGGGTGGHIFPAISIANAIKRRWPDAEILFVGAEDRMEMERVPAAGYKIEGLPVAGFDRNKILKNVKVLFKLLNSMSKARSIIKRFKPDIAIGVGGYASGPTLRVANNTGIPTLIQEQNSYAGVTNKLLAKKASSICVAYEGMERFFPADKIVLTGNPCRQDLIVSDDNKKQGYSYFNLNENKRTILIVGGSLGAASINNSVMNSLDKMRAIDDVQIIWQCGKYYYQDILKHKEQGEIPENIKLMDFISRMDYAYSVADLIISRAGAGSISEFCLLGKAVILVPSPNVAEDHQTKNAMALVKKDAAIMVEDRVAVDSLFDIALQLVKDDDRLRTLEDNIVKLGIHDSADKIVDEVEKIIGK
ncbi:MAG: undecaprenyldiphospho-muramoylpentapeptide beta-N-acetylglucosaminyltransferase [Fermentimonas sp.]|jgi:UDP-N-acetylglucosamine--N-acetylmuramyl-(pentapeptide) pyrophosphoryl-undecaprenol N-acetylglucosamine transferase